MPRATTGSVGREIGAAIAGLLTIMVIAAGCADDRPSASATPAKAALVNEADFRGHLDQLVVRLAVSPPGDTAEVPKVKLREVVLYVPADLAFEPPAVWPDDSPMSEVARISGDRAGALLDALAAAGYFRAADASDLEPGTTGLMIELRADARDSSLRRVVLVKWGPECLRMLDAVRGAVDGDAAKVVGEMHNQVSAFLGESP